MRREDPMIGGINIANRLELHEGSGEVHAGQSKLQSCVTTTGRAREEGRALAKRGGKAERRKLVIIYHAADINSLFYCQIIDCYDLNE